MKDSSETIARVVLALLAIAALILLLPLRNLPETHLTSRIIISTILLAICGITAIWYKPTD